MTEEKKERHGLHAVKPGEKKDPDRNFRAEIRSHRFHVLLRWVILIAAVAALIFGVLYYFSRKQYTGFEVQSETEREDTAATRFELYNDGLLKYSDDGAFYTDLEGGLIWNQTYEMEQPKAEISGKYVAIGDIGGMNLFIMNELGQQGSISTTLPIYAFSVAEQGTLAVLLSGDDTFYLRIYSDAGEELASGQLHISNSGYPMALAMSNDGKKLGLSSMFPTGNSVTSTITFYNFGSVGQNEPDNIVGVYSYEDMVIPEIHFMSNDTMIAFGDREIQIYSGAQKPEPVETLPVEEEIKSVFYNNTYFGLIFNNEDEENSRHIEVYDKRCHLHMQQDFVLDYHTAEFLNDNEVCVRNDYDVKLFGQNGVERFCYTFDVPVYKIVHEHFGMYYTIVCEGSTKKVRLQ